MKKNRAAALLLVLVMLFTAGTPALSARAEEAETDYTQFKEFIFFTKEIPKTGVNTKNAEIISITPLQDEIIIPNQKTYEAYLRWVGREGPDDPSDGYEPDWDLAGITAFEADVVFKPGNYMWTDLGLQLQGTLPDDRFVYGTNSYPRTVVDLLDEGFINYFPKVDGTVSWTYSKDFETSNVRDNGNGTYTARLSIDMQNLMYFRESMVDEGLTDETIKDVKWEICVCGYSTGLNEKTRKLIAKRGTEKASRLVQTVENLTWRPTDEILAEHGQSPWWGVVIRGDTDDSDFSPAYDESTIDFGDILKANDITVPVKVRIDTTGKELSKGSIAMYRLYNPNSREHLYTRDAYERSVLIGRGWQDEGIGWYAPPFSNTPVYRLYNPYSGDHHYTTDYNEYTTLAKNRWEQEGIGWFSDDDKTVPLYRQWSPILQTGTHNYTADLNEKNTICDGVAWVDEGIGWYGKNP